MSTEDPSVSDASVMVGDQAAQTDATLQSQSDSEALARKKDQLLSEVKKLKKSLAEQASALEQANNEKLAAEGKKDELIAQYKKQAEEAAKRNKEIHAKFAFGNVKQQLTSVAAQYGCVDVDALIALADLSGVDVDDQSYKADESLIKGIVEEMKVKKPYLFNKKTPNFDTSLPTGKVGEPKGMDLKTMSSQQLLELAHQMKRQTKGV